MNLRQAYELEKLSGAFFSMDVLLLGNHIWVRSYLPITAFLFITQYFVSDTTQSLLTLISLPVTFFLIQKAAEHVGRKRYDLRVLESCWWSVWWRATLYTIAIGVVLFIAVAIIIYPVIRDLDLESLTAEEIAKEISARDPLRMGVDSAIILFLFYIIGSFLAVGYATLRAFRVSCIRTHQCPQHVDMEQVTMEEEQSTRAGPLVSPLPAEVATRPASASDNRYAPPPDYTIQATMVPPVTKEPVIQEDEKDSGEDQSSEDLSRYMPPAEKPPERNRAADTELPQPTDLVGAAPGNTIRKNHDALPARRAETPEDDNNENDEEM